jgi:hypothetical protein
VRGRRRISAGGERHRCGILRIHYGLCCDHQFELDRFRLDWLGLSHLGFRLRIHCRSRDRSDIDIRLGHHGHRRWTGRIVDLGRRGRDPCPLDRGGSG